MGRFVMFLCCVALSINLVVSLTTSDGEKDQPGLRHPRDSTNIPGEEVVAEARVEREAVEKSSSNSTCRVWETSANVTKIITSEETAYSFFFKPLPGFRRLVINMLVDNDMDVSGAYEHKEKSVVVNGWELGQDSIDEDGWVPVKVEYYRHRVSWAPDRLGLRVTVGANSSVSRSINTRNRWTHDYEGFVAYMDGRAEFVTGCIPPSVVLPIHHHHLSASHSELQVQHIKSPLLLLVLALGGLLLVLTVLIAVLVVMKRRRSSRDGRPPLPKQLPRSTLLKGRGRSKTELDHIYEEFDEDAMAKLRRKLELDNFTCNSEENDNDDDDDDDEEGHYTKPPQPVRVHRGGKLKERLKKGGAAKNPKDVVEGASMSDKATYLNMNLNLQEAKAKAWKEDPKLGTPPEEHYVEMHGIVSRTSSLSNK
ncbi:hypothetical protein Pcinc_032560 [Petrolisthes cinctipes]|uniref:Uncharacterized protein n=1 Tax=Petrolisthes cinctipes TaxID=88211 RepID=A0AAE1K2U2_PETCI|nr:hypothetical protein Pcinc_032560 [Petrolisthes cinctipes]